jgi:hypothetical protein
MVLPLGICLQVSLCYMGCLDSPYDSLDGEIYDLKTNRWEPLPEPPFSLENDFIFAALENPNRIMIAPLLKREKDFAIFYMYDVENLIWCSLGKRQVHHRCPIGWEEWGQLVVTAGNTLYWITCKSRLLAYNIEKDFKSEGKLTGLGISFLKHKKSHVPGFVHLEGQLFGLLQVVSDQELHLVIIDVAIQSSSLQISVVANHRYKTEYPTIQSDCFL